MFGGRAASKKKGLWMGGQPSLGYDVRDRKLVANEPEAQTVRHVFRRYAELGSVRLLKQELDRDGVVSKVRKAADGAMYGGKSFSRGALYLMLQNRIYRGEITHKGTSYPGGIPRSSTKPFGLRCSGPFPKTALIVVKAVPASNPACSRGSFTTPRASG
jgi:hypothetical protein